MTSPVQQTWNQIVPLSVNVISVPVPEWNRVRSRVEKAKRPGVWWHGAGTFILGLGLPTLLQAWHLAPESSEVKKVATWVAGAVATSLGAAAIFFAYVRKKDERAWLDVVIEDMDQIAAMYPPSAGIGNTSQSTPFVQASPSTAATPQAGNP